MTIHYQKLDDGGIAAAYLVEQKEGIDQVVRRALDMKSIEPKDPLTIDLRKKEQYLIEGSGGKEYYTPFTTLEDTSCRVRVPSDGTPVVVIVRSTSPIPDLERYIEIVYIKAQLIPQGLKPIESTREQILPSCLR